MIITRREWLRVTAASLGSVAVAHPVRGDQTTSDSKRDGKAQSDPAKWVIGCFNRPWMRYSYDDALDGMQKSGFQQTAILGDHEGEAFTAGRATEDSLDRLNERVQARGLTLIAGWLKTTHTVPFSKASELAHAQIENAHRLGLKYMLSCGVDPPSQYNHFYQVMTDAAEFAKERGIQIVIKPHGGISAAADEILRCIELVNHDNFRVWFDPGNIVHYTGKDPVAEFDRLAPFVTGFCAKDCAGKQKDVMLQFGTGVVDFAALFGRMKKAAFNGPILIECCAGKSKDELMTNMRSNREFLERKRHELAG